MTWVKDFDLDAGHVSASLLYDEREKMDWRFLFLILEFKIVFSDGTKNCSNFKIFR